MKTEKVELHHWEGIWSEHQKSIKNFLHSKVANNSDVEDLQQDIFIKAYNKLDSLRSIERARSWLFQIANHTIIDFYRRQARVNQLEVELSGYEGSVEYQQGHRQYDLAQCVQPFIRNMPTEYASLLTAIDIEGQSQKNYAKRNGLHYSTLKSKVQKARAELRKKFEFCLRRITGNIDSIVDIDVDDCKCSSC